MGEWPPAGTDDGGEKDWPAAEEGVGGPGRGPLPSTPPWNPVEYPPSASDSYVDTMKQVRKERQTRYSLRDYFCAF